MPHPSVHTALVPPLSLSWKVDTPLSGCLAAQGTLYGIDSTGGAVALMGATGSQRWVSSGRYIPGRLSRQGNRLFAYRLNQGLTFLDDNGSSVAERLVIQFNATPEAHMSAILPDGNLVYYAVNQGLYAVHQAEGLRFGALLGVSVPYSAALISAQHLVLVNGEGIPMRFEVTDTGFSVMWEGRPHGVKDGLAERPFLVAENRLVVGVGPETIAYDLDTGRIAWRLTNLTTRALATSDGMIYVAAPGASIWAVRATDGSVVWQRQYLYNRNLFTRMNLIFADGHLYCGGHLSNPDQAILLAIRAYDGAFTWLSRAAGLNWVGGLPVFDGERIYCSGPTDTGAYAALSAAPRVLPDHIAISPRPMRGRATAFGPGQIQVNLSTPSRMSIAAYREAEGVSSPIVNGANWSTGLHEVSWSPSGSRGYTDSNQFGYMLFDVVENNNGASYTQVLLVPVNTFPDIQEHWARQSIEAMVFHKYVSGYLDQTFKPNSLVTRAESSTIIAKTLDLEQPSHGFRTQFTDIGTHWARQHIMALEEQQIIGGFAEPDGTYTFRPDLHMTRAQEARILVRAYGIPLAAPDFQSKFTDIRGHWAESDIRALESAGYVNGFQEVDGSYTYRPEKNLTRAELCTVVVRIRNLSR